MNKEEYKTTKNNHNGDVFDLLLIDDKTFLSINKSIIYIIIINVKINNIIKNEKGLIINIYQNQKEDSSMRRKSEESFAFPIRFKKEVK